MSASKQYRDKQDHFSKFVTERLEEDVDGWTQKRDIYEEFKLWYTENEGKDVPKGKELFDFLEKKYGYLL